MIFTSRSRIVAYANCPRYGYLAYDWQGTGLEAVQTSLPLAFGIEGHEALAGILLGTSVEMQLSKSIAAFAATIEAKGVRNEEVTAFFVREQQALLEGTLRAFARVRLPALKADFEFVAVEKEILWPVSPDIIDRVRCDVLARRRSDGGLFYVEWKTTSGGGDDWAKQWEHNTQLLANTLAIEETLGERVEGVMIEGLVKGRRKIDESLASPFFGQRIQNSPVCYGWVHEATGDYSVRFPRGKGWRKIPTWEIPGGGTERWVNEIMGVEDCRALFAPVPPIRPRREHLERWRRQTIAAERERAAKLDMVAKDPRMLDMAFPMNDEHCFRYWGHPCEFEPLCFGGEIAEDPVGSGLYQPHTPHHESVEDKR